MRCAIRPMTGTLPEVTCMTSQGPKHMSPWKTSVEPRKKKQRSWTYLIKGINAKGPQIAYADVLASFSERYTAVKRLVLSPASGASRNGNINNWGDARAVVDFRGPTPGAGPGKSLRQLLNATSFEVEDDDAIERIRRFKRARLEESSTEASDPERGKNASKRVRLPEFLGSFGGLDITSTPSALHATSPTYFCEAPGRDQRGEPMIACPDSPFPLSTGGMFTPSTSMLESPSVADAFRAEKIESRKDILRRGASVDCLGRKQSPGSWDSGNSSGSDGTHVTAVVDREELKIPSPPILEGLVGGTAWSPNDLCAGTRDSISSLGAQKNQVADLATASSEQDRVNGVSCNPVEVEGDDHQSGNITRGSSSKENATPIELGCGATLRLGNPVDTHPTRGCVPGLSAYKSVRLNENISQMKAIVVEPLQTPQECNFEGIATTSTTSGDPASAKVFRPGCECHLAFLGLEGVKQSFQNLNVTAQFSVDSSHTVGKTASPIQMGPMGRMYAAVWYPSMKELWPEVYEAVSVQTVKVDMVIEVRSTDGTFNFVAPTLQVTYQRLTDPNSGV